MTSRFVAALEELYGSLQILHPDLPNAEIMYVFDTESYGMAWTDPSHRIIAVTTLAADSGPKHVLSTMLHEATHMLAAARGIKDQHGSRFHNQRFATLAYIAFGLKTYWHSPEYGWAHTKVTRRMKKFLRGEYKQIRKAMR